MVSRKRRSQRLVTMVVSMLATAIFVVLSIAYFADTLRKKTDDTIISAMRDHANSQAVSLQFAFENKLHFLESTASFIGRSPSNDIHTQMRLMQSAIDAQEFSWMRVVNQSGISLSDTGMLVDVSGQPYYEDMLANKRIVYHSDDDLQTILFAVPIYQDGQIAGALCAGAPAENFAHVLWATPRESACILAGNGRVIASSDDENLLSNYVGKNIFDNLSLNPLQADFDARKNGVLLASVDGADYHFAYTPIVATDWYVLFAFPQEQTDQTFAYIFDEVRDLELNFAAGGCFLLCMVIFSAYSKKREVQEEALQLTWSQARYRILATDSNEAIWEFDIDAGEFYEYETFVRLFGALSENTFEALVERVHPHDRNYLVSLWRGLLNNTTDSWATLELRIMNKRRKRPAYTWCRMRMSVLKDSRGFRRRLIGKITDISQEKLKTERLERKARTDALTGLLNRAGLEEAIRLRLDREEPTPCAVAILDVDNFKGVNDNYGHGVGDMVLRSFAGFLRTHFRGTDIVGRLGGDEFMILIESVDTQEKLNMALAWLQDGVSKIHVNDIDLEIHFSIGVALCPKTGDTFETLYKHADIALYQAKHAAKKEFVIFEQ